MGCQTNIIVFPPVETKVPEPNNQECLITVQKWESKNRFESQQAIANGPTFVVYYYFLSYFSSLVDLPSRVSPYSFNSSWTRTVGCLPQQPSYGSVPQFGLFAGLRVYICTQEFLLNDDSILNNIIGSINRIMKLNGSLFLLVKHVLRSQSFKMVQGIYS